MPELAYKKRDNGIREFMLASIWFRTLRDARLECIVIGPTEICVI